MLWGRRKEEPGWPGWAAAEAERKEPKSLGENSAACSSAVQPRAAPSPAAPSPAASSSPPYPTFPAPPAPGPHSSPGSLYLREKESSDFLCTQIK